MQHRLTLNCSSISFGYAPGTTAIRLDQLELSPGMITVFCGGNGTGKTTLMKLIAGLLTPQSGTISGRDGSGSPLSPAELKLRSVYVHQDPYILKGTVRQNIAFFLPRANGRGGEDTIRESLGHMGLEGFEKRLASELSGGERKRLALARALAAGKQIMLLDEPTANVDAASTGKLIERLAYFKQAGFTTVVATHDEDFSRRIADRVYRFGSATLQAESRPEI